MPSDDFDFDFTTDEPAKEKPIGTALITTNTLSDMGAPAEPLGSIPQPEPTPLIRIEEPSPHLRFRQVHERLLTLETLQKAGKPVDLKEVQTLVKEAAELVYRIQTSTTGPKKKAPVMDADPDAPKKGRKKAPPKPSTIAHLNIPAGDDF